MQVIGAAVAVMVAIVVVVIATRSDDSSGTTAGTDVVDIGGPATVTGITGAAPLSQPSEASDPNATTAASTVNGATSTSGGAQTLVLQRTLLEPGTYNCTDTGVWQPFTGLDVTLLVGEPEGGSSCTTDVLDMPLGACSKTPCAEVPEDWRFETLAGTPPQALLMVVAPASTTTSEFVCVVDLVPQPKQILADDATIEEVCPAAATVDSSDIPPYVPPDTSDIPYVPPPVSVDLPAG
jgi:hypothetical protein